MGHSVCLLSVKTHLCDYNLSNQNSLPLWCYTLSNQNYSFKIHLIQLVKTRSYITLCIIRIHCCSLLGLRSKQGISSTQDVGWSIMVSDLTHPYENHNLKQIFKFLVRDKTPPLPRLQISISTVDDYSPQAKRLTLEYALNFIKS